MEVFTRADIGKYVRTCMTENIAIGELRCLDPIRIDRFESNMIDRAEGIFSGKFSFSKIVLAVQVTVQDNSDLQIIQKPLRNCSRDLSSFMHKCAVDPYHLCSGIPRGPLALSLTGLSPKAEQSLRSKQGRQGNTALNQYQ